LKRKNAFGSEKSGTSKGMGKGKEMREYKEE